MTEIYYLINYLLNENPKIKLNEKPENFNQQFAVYRSLANIRPPKPLPEEYHEKEDQLLQKLNTEKTLTDVENVQTLDKTHPESNIKHKDTICLWQGDITTLKIGAITNAANSQGLGCFVPCHNCIDNQINTYAGTKLRLECNEHMKKINYNLPTGEAFTTNAYNLPSKYVIHTVGPIIQDKVTEQHKKQLHNCYTNVLEEAYKNNIETVAFCSISTGEFRFPKELACKIAVETVDNYLEENDHFKKILFNVYSQEDKDIYDRFITKDYRN